MDKLTANADERRLRAIAVGRGGPGFVALQRLYGTEKLREQFKRRALLQVIGGTGLRLKRKFVTGYRPPIKNVPEQYKLRS